MTTNGFIITDSLEKKFDLISKKQIHKQKMENFGSILDERWRNFENWEDKITRSFQRDAFDLNELPKNEMKRIFFSSKFYQKDLSNKKRR